MKYLFLLSASLVIASPAIAQGQKPQTSAGGTILDENGEYGGQVDGAVQLPDDAITVTATGWWTKRQATGQSISVITADQIEAVQGSDPVRLLERLPGVATSRNGPLGSATTVFVRGANSQQLLVTIDGVRVDDQAAPSGGFDFGTLLNGGIGRIELLRGSNSLAWGSDAIGGVLAVTTDDRPGLRAGAEYGANETLSTDAGWATRGDNYSLALNGGYAQSDGISAFAGGTEADAFRQWRVNGKGAFDLTDSVSLVAAGRYADSKIDFDGYPAPFFDTFADTPEYQTTRQGSGRVGLEYNSDGFDLTGGVALSDTRRAYYDPTYDTAPNFNTIGRGVHADLKGRVDLSGGLRLDFGADGDWARYSTTYDPRQTARTLGAHALLGYHDDRLSLTAGGRIDDHDRFGSHTTLGANGSFALADNWRVRASWGQGFKAPSLSQLYGYRANPLLQPETSDAYDAALEFDDGTGHVAVTVFRRDSSNLIDFVSPTGYLNIGRARAQGIELEGAVAIEDSLTLSGAYTFLDATNRLTGKELARRPRHSLSVSLDWRAPVAGIRLGADFRLVGERFDDGGNSVPLDSYGLVSLRASVPVGPNFELYGRVENVTDQAYETAAGYGNYGRSAYAGVRLKW